MRLAVYNFNKPRNKFVWDAKHEQEMLAEEIKEFATATSVHERLDAMVDTMYVWEGTKMKALFNSELLSDDFVKGIEDSLILMNDLLREELDMSFANFNIVLNKAIKIVCDANAMKPYKLSGKGKVEKNKDTPNATKQIEAMLKSHQEQ